MEEYTIGEAGIGELPRFREWARAEGWNPGGSDLLPFHAADPGGFLLGRLGGEPVASLSAVRYGEDYGFLGFYLVRPALRGRGYGLRIWQAAVRRLGERNIGLDGVVAQQENYRRSGFRRAWNHVRYEGVPSGEPAPADIALADGRSVPFGRLAAYDRRFFPAERNAFLSLWLGLSAHVSLVAIRNGELAGLAVSRPAAAGVRVGPLYAASPEVGLALLNGIAARAPGTAVVLDVPDVNPAAVGLVERLGLVPTFECARMYTGQVPEIDVYGIFATTTLELG
ncbi:GNAT family N-acetyltransferase [Streptomyces hoynatensis]|uniref:GNAT family N-acetyltransferase n=1 Tax=Streptomyces hoynatensis TaxID=1141874 RepID=A0A3A9Z9I0_9ACTN|nr:GNAT family N-acetyltransferase [Streptomyces hoynatensis]RKN43957.1 GNAT family N-acetyltransferase [Streptomyces hoynatensis]